VSFLRTVSTGPAGGGCGSRPGLTRGVVEKFAAGQMIDVHVRPPMGGRAAAAHHAPEPELRRRLETLKLDVPAQPPRSFPRWLPSELPPCSADFWTAAPIFENLRVSTPRIREGGLVGGHARPEQA